MVIRVLLVEDHVVVRQGLRALLHGSSDFEVIGEFGSGDEAIAHVPQLKPDVVLMDLSLPGVHGTEVIRRIKQGSKTMKVLVLSMHTSSDFVARAREAGCDGYVVKGSSISELTDAIRAVHAGYRFFSSDVAQAVSTENPSDRLGRLSARERQVLRLIAEGSTNRDVAKRLGISIHTVNAHRVNLMAKLDLHDVQGLTRFALRHGLVAPED